MIIDAFNLEARMNAITASTLKAAATVGMSTATTDEGKRQQWDMYLARIEDALNDVRDDLAAVRKGVEAAPDYIRATVLGTRPAQPDTALELSLARILGRRDEWTTAELLETIRPILGTPLCAELVAELEAREQVKWDELEPQLPELAPELSAYRRALPFVAAAVDQLEKLAAEMEKATEF